MLPVSVIVPNFNSGTYLRQCIASINAGVPPDEIIIIDDCSTDGSNLVAADLATQHHNVRVISTTHNSGAADARRLGMSSARNEYVALVDADDFIEDDAIHDAYVSLIENKADICLWHLHILNNDATQPHPANPATLPLSGTDAVLLTLGAWRIHSLGVTRKSLFDAAYLDFHETMPTADELLHRLVLSGAQLIVGSSKKYFYRSHPASTTKEMGRFTVRRLGMLAAHAWLADFAARFPGAPTEKMALDALWEATQVWRNRHQIGTVAVRRAIKDAVPRILRASHAWRWIWRHPRYAAAAVVLLILAR